MWWRRLLIQAREYGQVSGENVEIGQRARRDRLSEQRAANVSPKQTPMDKMPLNKNAVPSS
jgi:hypothetical protein